MVLAVRSQNYSGFDGVISAGKNDASALMKVYMAPAMEGMVYSMSGGWYHTAKTHNKLGFDITIAANAAFIPSKKGLFSFADFQFENTITASSGITPTVAGDATPADVTVVTSGGSATFTMPEGVKSDLPLHAMPAPMLQAGIGLFFNTDIMLRFMPKVGSDDVKGSLFGVGLKHNLMQYFGPLDNLLLNVSLLGAFSSMDVDYDIANNASIEGKDQAAEFNLKSYTVQGLASLDFPFISIYSSVGYTGGKSELDVLGTYTVNYTGSVQSTTFTDPIAIALNPSSFRTSLGARLSLGFFKIFADYTLQEYNSLSAGIAFGFR